MNWDEFHSGLLKYCLLFLGEMGKLKTKIIWYWYGETDGSQQFPSCGKDTVSRE